MARRRGRREGRRWLGIVLVALVACTLLWVQESGPGPRSSVHTDTGVLCNEARQRPEDAVDGREEVDGHLEGVSGDAGTHVPDLDGVATGGWTEVRREEGNPEQVATRLLRAYRDAGGCVLARSGYLDLAGSVWGCVVQGNGWTDVCVVCATAEEGVSELRVMRLDADEMTDLLADEP